MVALGWMKSKGDWQALISMIFIDVLQPDQLGIRVLA